MLQSINVNGFTVSLYAKDSVNAKGNQGYRANGKLQVTVGAEMHDLSLTVNGTLQTATVKRNDDGSLKQNEKGNYGWRLNGKVTVDGRHYQLGLHVTPIKMPNVIPQGGQFNVIITGDVTEYQPTKGAKPAATTPKVEAPKPTPAPKKAKKAANEVVAPPVESKPLSQEEVIARMVAEMLSGKR